MKTEILRMLKSTGDYLSGQQLCGMLGVSRTAVWKAVGELREEGYVIEAVRNRGYRLVEGADVITQAELASMLHTQWIGTRLEYFDETDSTNTRARKLAEEGAPHGTLVIADSQSSGKGRRGRLWTSPRGVGIWMSMLLRPDIAPVHASMLTLIAGMAVVRGVKESTGLDAMIKWPNDAVLAGRKICGILTEMSTEDETIRYVITGIGINVNIDEFPEEIRDTATSHDRLFFIEVMGRDAGFLALNGAIASGAEAAIIPEISMEKDQLAEMIETGFRKSKNSSIVLVAESEVTGGAMGVAERVKKEYPQFDVRVSILGHLQRGGSPTAQDRILATRMGVAAVDALLDDQRNVMMGIQNDEIVYVPFSKAIKNDKPINRDLLNTLRISSI